MKRILLAATTLSILAVAPASAQMMGGGMMGGPGMMGSDSSGPRSCVSNGAFVPCPPMGMQAGMGGGMGMQSDMPPRRMTRAEKRRMMREQQSM